MGKYNPYKRSKYRNTPTIRDGVKYDSKKEMKRYNELLLMQRAGLISNLQKQVKFELIPAIWEDVEVQLKTKTKIVKKSVQQSICYIADFTYEQDGILIVNDVKASKDFHDPVYGIKKKLLRYTHGIDILETYI